MKSTTFVGYQTLNCREIQTRFFMRWQRDTFSTPRKKYVFLLKILEKHMVSTEIFREIVLEKYPGKCDIIKYEP